MALLVAIAALIVVLAALAATLQSTATTQRAVMVDVVHEQQANLRQAGEALACAWITRNAETLVLSPTAGPVLVTHDEFVLHDDRATLTVWVMDGLSALPWPAIQPRGVLREDLPGRWAGFALPGATAENAESVAPCDALERLDLPVGLGRYPQLLASEPRRWQSQASVATTPTPVSADSLATTPTPEPSAVDVIAFTSDGRINRNTAPAWVLAAVYRRHDRGGLEDALRRREQRSFDDHDDPATRDGIRLVARSDRWHAFITTSWNGRTRVWWVDLVGNSTEVRIVQRHDAQR